MKTRRFHHICPVLKSFHWLKINQRIDYKIISLTYKAQTQHPAYIFALSWSSAIITLTPPQFLPYIVLLIPRILNKQTYLVLVMILFFGILYLIDMRKLKNADPHIFPHIHSLLFLLSSCSFENTFLSQVIPLLLGAPLITRLDNGIVSSSYQRSSFSSSSHSLTLFILRLNFYSVWDHSSFFYRHLNLFFLGF